MSDSSERIAKKVAKVLLEIKAVTLSPKDPYTYTSGIKSPIYCDNRLLVSYPEKRKIVRDSFIKLIKENNIEFDVVAGTATAGIPHAAWIADKLNKPMIYIRSKPKDYGKENLVEGQLLPGQKVIVIEDLVSTGGSSVAAVQAVRDAGGKVDYCFAIFSYQLKKAEEKFNEANCRLIALSNFNALVKQAKKLDYIKKEDLKIVLEWNSIPDEWGKKHGFQ